MLGEMSAPTTSEVIDYIHMNYGTPRKPLYALVLSVKVGLYAWLRLTGKTSLQTYLEAAARALDHQRHQDDALRPAGEPGELRDAS